MSNGEMRVGEKIKRLREDEGISLEDLGKRIGFSPSVISQIENHLVSPPLGILIKISRALKVKLGYFFSEFQDEKGEAGPEEPFTIVRKDERKKISRVASKEGVNYGYSYESLGFGKKDRQMEPFLVSLEPRSAAAGEEGLSAHEGEEFVFVLEGEMEVQLGNHTDVLSGGDSIYYDSTIPHRVRCAGGKPAKILAVIYTPQ
ncbi:MAG: cupin domain-containing protein [bacterium]|nr:cupin domain-containing protein [bacterium]